MTAELVRLPDQFRPARSTPTSATPTCCSCCCCCCCAATLISASVVLPMQVEILARRGMVGGPGTRILPRPPNDLRRRKALGALAPSLAIFGWILVTMNGSLTLGLLTVPAVLVGLGYIAFAPFPNPGVRAAANAAVIISAFAVEFVVGLFLLLATFGIGYVILMVVVPIVVIKTFVRRRDALPPLDATRPPPFPWPREG